MLPDRPADAPRAIAAPLYLIGALLVVLPVLDLLVNVWPLQPGNFRWRFGVVGLFASYLLTPLLGVALLAGTAALAPQPIGRRVVGILNVVGGGALLAAVAVFVLDLLQLRPLMTDEALASFDVANVRALVKLLLGVVALLWLGLAGLRRPRAAAAPASATPRPRPGPLVADEGASRA